MGFSIEEWTKFFDSVSHCVGEQELEFEYGPHPEEPGAYICRCYDQGDVHEEAGWIIVRDKSWGDTSLIELTNLIQDTKVIVSPIPSAVGAMLAWA